MQNSIFTPKIKKIISKPKGLKVALFDSRSYTVLSTCIPHTYLLANDFFLLSMIEDKNRTKMSQISCSAFISKEGVVNLLQELKAPIYGSYNVYFLNSINDESLKELAKADKFGVVNEVYEIFIDLHQIEDNLFVINPSDEHITDTKRIQCLTSLLNTLEIQPTICAINDLKDLGNDLSNSLEKYNRKRIGNMLIFDRKYDMITPLVYNWYYQSMLYDYTEYNLGLVNQGKKTFQLFNDEVFAKTKFTDIANLKNIIIESKKDCNPRIDFNDIFCTNLLTENNTNKVETHLTLHNIITSESVKNGIMSDLEYSILSDKNFFKEHQEKIESVLKDKQIQFEYRLKFFLINAINLLDLNSKKEMMISNWFIKRYPEFLEAFYKFLEIYKPKKDSLPYFKKDMDLKLGYIPPIIKIIKNFTNLQLKNFYFVKKANFKKNERMIIYFKGGVTYHEYQCIQTNYPNTIVIGDNIIGYKNILNRIVENNNK